MILLPLENLTSLRQISHFHNAIALFLSISDNHHNTRRMFALETMTSPSEINLATSKTYSYLRKKTVTHPPSCLTQSLAKIPSMSMIFFWCKPWTTLKNSSTIFYIRFTSDIRGCILNCQIMHSFYIVLGGILTSTKMKVCNFFSTRDKQVV